MIAHVDLSRCLARYLTGEVSSAGRMSYIRSVGPSFADFLGGSSEEDTGPYSVYAPNWKVLISYIPEEDDLRTSFFDEQSSKSLWVV